MKLRFSPTSPYVRKVSISAIELGIDDQIERQLTDAWSPESDIADDNPLSKVPALSTEDAGVLCDSTAICQYLDHRAGGQLFPADPADDSYAVLRLYWLANGVMDASVQCAIERFKRPEDARSEEWTRKQVGKIKRALPLVEREIERQGQNLNIATITTAAALGYIAFRQDAEVGWRAHSSLASWYDQFARRPSMEQTRPDL